MPARTKWNVTNCWVASFDILGFKNMVDVEGGTFEAKCIQEDYEETLGHLESKCGEYHLGDLEYCWLSDTFIMFTPDDSGRSYTVIQQAAKHFIEKCLFSSIPIRGALSVGSFIRNQDNRSLMGRAFIEAFVYGEDQDWLGFLLAPSAISKVRAYGVEPTHHDFVASDRIPMRKLKDREVLAYRFQNGAANFSPPLIPILQGMRHKAGKDHQAKYDRTIEFIENHYQRLPETIT